MCKDSQNILIFNIFTHQYLSTFYIKKHPLYHLKMKKRVALQRSKATLFNIFYNLFTNL